MRSGRLLDIAVQALVRVEVRAVGREVENLDLILPSIQPRAHQSRPVNLQPVQDRSEEHTSELQSRQYLVCRLLLEKKKKKKDISKQKKKKKTERKNKK